MSDLERTSSWNGLEIIEEADELKKAAATDEVNDSEGKNETPDKASSSSDGSDSNGSAGNGPENKQEPRRQLTPQERRAERQKRRKKSRMIAFAVFAVLVIITAIGAGFGIKALNEKKAAEQPQFPVVEELPVEEEKTVVDMTPVITQEVEEEEPEEEKEPEQTKDELLDEMIESMIAEMTLEDKVAGLFVVTPESLTGQSAVTKAGDGTKKALEQYPVGGVIYFKQNISSSDQIKEMMSLLFDGFDPQKFDGICRSLNIDAGIFGARGYTVSKLSDGNLMKLMLATVFARNTELLLLDEPASSLDPLMRDMLSDMIRAYLADGDGLRSVVFSTHNISDMENVTDYVIIIDDGKILEEGFVTDLKEKYILVKGEAEYLSEAKKNLITCQASSFGFEGVALTDNMERFAGMDVEFVTPSLFNVSVAVMKQNSKISMPVL